MTGSTVVGAEVEDRSGPEARRGHLARLGGLGGLVFVTVVIAQNVVRAAIAPANDATPASIVTHYVDDRSWYLLLGASFAASAVGLALFVGAWWGRVRRTDAPGWAGVGLLGATGIFTLFPMMVATEFGLLVTTDRARPDTAVVDALWTLHNATFQVLDTAIAIATLGVAIAAVSAGIAPRAFRWLGPVGAGLLLIGTLAGPQLAAGDAQPLMGLAGLGFLVWLALVGVTSGRLLRDPAA